MSFSIPLDVTPEQLRVQMNTVSADVEEIAKQIQTMFRCLEETKSYWRGDAADLHRSQLDDARGQIDAIVASLRFYPTRIEQIANNYGVIIPEVRGITATLSTDLGLSLE